MGLSTVLGRVVSRGEVDEKVSVKPGKDLAADGKLRAQGEVGLNDRSERAKAFVHLKLQDFGALEVPAVVAVLMSKRITGTAVGDWREMDRMYVDNFESRRLHAFHGLFYLDEEQLVRIEFRSTGSVVREEEQPRFLGAVETLLSQVWQSPGEWLQVKLKEMSGNAVSSSASSMLRRPNVSIILERVKNLRHKVAFEMALCINRRSPKWPFSSARPFFVVYRSEANGSWAKLYRSEVLVRPGDRRGPGYFKTIELSGAQLNDYNDNRPLRLEFYHFKLHGNEPKLLGHVDTSVSALRQAAHGAKMELVLNDIGEGDIRGSVRMKESTVNASRSHFTLLATFGEKDEETESVYMKLNCAVQRTDTWPSSSAKLMLTVSSIGPDRCTLLHTSEVVKPNRDGVMSFAMITILNWSFETPNGNADMRIDFYQLKSAKDKLLLGSVTSALEELRSLPVGRKLTFQSAVEGDLHIIGRVTVQQIECNDSKTYLVLRCVLGHRGQARSLPATMSVQSFPSTHS